MPLIRPGIVRLFSFGQNRARTIEGEVNDEIALHLELRAEQLRMSGLSPEQAHAEAQRRFGPATEARDTLNAAARHRNRTMNFREQMSSLADDVRYAARGLKREPAFTSFIAITLGLGIGLNAAMYGVVDRLLLRGPEHVRDAQQVQNLYITTQPAGMPARTNHLFGYVTYDVLRKNSKRVQVATFRHSKEGIQYGTGLNAVQWSTAESTADLFPLLGATPLLGRFYSAEEDSPSNPQSVIVLGYNAWVRAYNSDSAIVGKTITLNDQTFTVVGVARKGFTGPALAPVDVWMPISIRSRTTSDFTANWNSNFLTVVARLNAGVTAEQASVEATALYRSAYAGLDSAKRTATLKLAPLSYSRDGTESLEVRISRWLIGVSIIVLIVACANVANLLLVRVIRRRREVAVRLALGVSRARLLRLFLVESLMLASIGTVAGLALAYGTGAFMRTVLLPDIEWTSSPVDSRVLVLPLIMTLVVGIGVGLLPAWRASRPNLTSALKSGIRDGGGHHSRLRTTLTVAQAALSVILLIDAGLFMRSLANIKALDLGVETDKVAVVTLRWPSIARTGSAEARQQEQLRRTTVYPLLLARVRQLADVERAGLAIGLPFQSSFGVDLRVPGWDSLPRLASGSPTVSAVSDGYFQATGARILRGRAFTSADRAGSEPVTIVSETMAKTLWPVRDAIGECLYSGDGEAIPCSRIVGIASDVHRFQLKEDPAMHYYVPFGQERNMSGTSLIVRRRGSTAAMIASVRRAAQEVDGTLRYVYAKSMQETVDPQIRPWRLGANIFSLMGVLALCVASIGLYSVMSYLVVQRRHEMGIRLALGATSVDNLRLIVRSGVGTAAIGVALGVLGALLGGRFIEPLLFDASPRDLTVFSSVIVCLMVVSVIASLVPAMRARAVNPIEALRWE